MRTLVIVILACCLNVAAFAQEKNSTPKTITVTGTAEAEIVPDEIYVQVSLREYDKRGAGKVDIETIKAGFLAACKAAGIADSNISILDYSGSDGYWQIKKSSKKDPNLKASVSYWVKVATTQTMSDLVEKLDDEATQSFTIAKTGYSKQAQLKKQLKIDAIKAAKAKAVYLAEAIDEHINGALTITDGEETVDDGHPNWLENARANVAQVNMAGDAADGIGFKKIKYQFQVTVVFALK
jgi:uncharacterized protein YggE